MSANKKRDAEWLLGGKGEIYRMLRSNQVYQCRIWVPSERKYVRKSLKTSDHETAKLRGEELIFKILGEVAQGKKLFGITLGELVDKFLDYRLEDAKNGVITEGRFTTIQSQCR
ncbi:MAG: integrase, partial [Gammaproteobacteria bacterium]